MSKEECTMESLPSECECKECTGYSEAFDAVWDLPHKGKRIEFINSVVSQTGQSKRLASRYVHILEYTGVISFSDKESKQ